IIKHNLLVISNIKILTMTGLLTRTNVPLQVTTVLNSSGVCIIISLIRILICMYQWMDNGGLIYLPYLAREPASRVQITKIIGEIGSVNRNSQEMLKFQGQLSHPI